MKNILKILFLLAFSFTFSSCNEDDFIETHEQKATIENLNKIASNLNVEMKVDSKVTKENSIVFESEDELVEFIRNLEGELENNNDVMITESCADGVYHGTGWTTGFTSLIFDVSISEGCISGINGNISGVGFPYSWSQGGSSFGCSSGYSCGTLSVNIFFGGIGTVYSFQQCFTISVSC